MDIFTKLKTFTFSWHLCPHSINARPHLSWNYWKDTNQITKHLNSNSFIVSPTSEQRMRNLTYKGHVQGLPGLRVCPQEDRDEAGTGESKSQSARVTDAPHQESKPLPTMGLYRSLQGEWLHYSATPPAFMFRVMIGCIAGGQKWSHRGWEWLPSYDPEVAAYDHNKAFTHLILLIAWKSTGLIYSPIWCSHVYIYTHTYTYFHVNV